MSEEKYYDDLTIDPNHLEDEWFRQPSLYMKYSEMAAEAIKERDQAKEKLDVVRGEQDKAIRLNPEKFKLTKTTDTVVTTAIYGTSEYQIANKELIEANYRLNIIQSVVKALDHKKKALESAAQLWIGSYWSTPREPVTADGEPKSFIKTTQDSAVSEQREGMNKKRKSRK